MDFKYKCKTCSYVGQLQDGSTGCSKFNIKIDLNKDGCSWHKSNAVTCCVCGKVDDNMILLYGATDDIYPFCSECYEYHHTCRLCKNGNICNFKADKSEPQIVSQTIRQGFVTMQQQIKNPNLVKKHCASCKCSWNSENCHKDDNGVTCPNWQLKTEMLR